MTLFACVIVAAEKVTVAVTKSVRVRLIVPNGRIVAPVESRISTRSPPALFRKFTRTVVAVPSQVPRMRKVSSASVVVSVSTSPISGRPATPPLAEMFEAAGAVLSIVTFPPAFETFAAASVAVTEKVSTPFGSAAAVSTALR